MISHSDFLNSCVKNMQSDWTVEDKKFYLDFELKLSNRIRKECMELLTRGCISFDNEIDLLKNYGKNMLQVLKLNLLRSHFCINSYWWCEKEYYTLNYCKAQYINTTTPVVCGDRE